MKYHGIAFEDEKNNIIHDSYLTMRKFRNGIINFIFFNIRYVSLTFFSLTLSRNFAPV